jgi:hypothetical protein
MKKFSLLLILFLFTARSFSQQAKDFTPNKNYYLQKSKNQKTSAFILLGVGLATTVTGILAYENNKYAEGFVFDYHDYRFLARLTTAIGVVWTAASIQLFIRSAKNKKKALNFDSYANQIPDIQNQERSSLETIVQAREYYLEKNKKAKKVAWILLGTGITSLTVGALLAENEDPNHEGFSPGTALGYAGAAMLWVSIPFFIEAGKNKRKATTLALESRPLQIPSIGNYGFRNQATFTLAIGL